MAELSVVIPTFNRLAFVREAIASIPEGVEIIVVDDGSTDGTRDAIPCIPNRGKGVSAARNTGVAAATTPLVGFLDDDDIWLPNHARLHIAAHKDRWDIVASYSRGQMANERLEPFGQPGPMVMPRNPGITACVQASATFVFRRDRFLPFNESLTDTEDLDWVERMGFTGDFEPIPETTVLYRQHPRRAGGYAAWANRYRQSRMVLGWSMKRSNDRRAKWNRWVRCHGWAVHDGLNEAERCLSEGRKGDALRLLARVPFVSPPHLAKVTPRYLGLVRQLP